MQKKYIYGIFAIVYASAIFLLSSSSNPPNPISRENIVVIYDFLKEHGLGFLAVPFYFAFKYPDKFAHILLYVGFGFVLNPAVRDLIKFNPYVMTILIGTSYGIFDEIHQMFVPGRSSSVMDLFADMLGLILSQIFVMGFNKYKIWRLKEGGLDG
ncbi:VanZ family protein [Ferroglobus placidus DSM 10642]|uniref:VanZ family protein n=1 Tax=Ferroglobus placidus (strain DSM 10642 / AEDII12DO) TaxID=589924 RepID=D3S000_FERPA|nr:VanZ family protein [Ferroglobus placidus]ADC66063.1 VanZ family protein [Ferroglobus placidus DSM 10642]